MINIALIAISVDLVSGSNRLREFILKLLADCTVQAASNIYKKQKTPLKNDFNSELWVVLKIETELGATELKSKLDSLSDIVNSKSICSGKVLTFNDIVWLKPDLPLPNPLLITENVILKCASEAWGDFKHPILGITLNEVSHRQEPPVGLEFFAQGKSLVL